MRNHLIDFDARITPAGRISMSDMSLEYTGATVRRTGMAEAGTWIGLPPGTRHGMDSYRSKSAIVHRDNITLTGAYGNTPMSSSYPHIIASLDVSFHPSVTTTIQGLPAGGYLRNPSTGAIFHLGAVVESRSFYTDPPFAANVEVLIAGVRQMHWYVGGLVSSDSVTLQIWY